MSWLLHRGGSETFFFPEPMQSGYAEDKASMKFKLLLAALIIAALAGIVFIRIGYKFLSKKNLPKRPG